MSQWSKPHEVSDVQMVFPANISSLMPPREECEKALDAMPDQGARWREVQHLWFFHGLGGATEVEPKEGIDPRAAIRHLHVIQGSYEPKHEHKVAAVAYLCSLWFDEFRPAPAKTSQ
jgi:hypothetical protein